MNPSDHNVEDVIRGVSAIAKARATRRGGLHRCREQPDRNDDDRCRQDDIAPRRFGIAQADDPERQGREE